MSETPKGFNCETCGKFHVFGVYAAAHQRDVLIHTCDCGAKHKIVMMSARQSKKGKKPKAK